MATFGELKASVSKRLLDRGNTAIQSSDVGDAINDAIGYWKKRVFWFNQEEALLPLTAGDSVIPNFPTDFLFPLQPGAFSMSYPGTPYFSPLPIFNASDYDWADVNYRGSPEGIGFISGSWCVYPYMSGDFVVKARYIKDYLPLVDDDDANAFTVLADRLILMQACSNLTGEFQQDDKMSPYYEGEAQKEYLQLKRQTNKILGTGRLSVYGYGNQYHQL